jgi:hypothetical protein
MSDLKIKWLFAIVLTLFLPACLGVCWLLNALGNVVGHGWVILGIVSLVFGAQAFTGD